MTGGYKIIDLYGLDLANMQLDSTKIEKIFNDIESTYKTKALLFDNYKINGIEQNATFSSAVVKNSGFEITLGDYKILIKNDSVVDSTPHLYVHNIYYDIKLEDTEEAYGVCSLYTNEKTPITKENLKDYIEDIHQNGFVAPGGSTNHTIVSIYYYENIYHAYTLVDTNITITNINDINDSIKKIF